MNAEQLLESMRPEIDRHISGNEFVARVRAGEIDHAQVQRLVIAEFYCQEAELPTYGLLVGRHRHEAPANLFGLTIHTVAKARRVLGPVAEAVGLRPDDLSVAAGGRLSRDLSLPGLLAEPGEAALYLHSDLSVWCPVFSELVEAAQQVDSVPKELIEYMAWWGSEPPQDITDGVLEVLTYALGQGEDPDRILDFARQLESGVSTYWDFVLTG
ncbi:hypothetical protein [Streptomyces sp. NPDC059819]|uniref:hypothetical protein n=1 Tax=Streptomyces sp. NPDC059819 TaxID=3346963 RepID=UPI0036678A08